MGRPPSERQKSWVRTRFQFLKALAVSELLKRDPAAEAVAQLLRNVQIDFPDPRSRDPLDLDVMGREDAVFERLKSDETRIRLGWVYLQRQPSEPNLDFTLAHELGHALDVMELQHFQSRGLRPSPTLKGLSQVSSCVANQVRTGSDRQLAQLEPRFEAEAFADWFGFEIWNLAHPNARLEEVTDALRDLCEANPESIEPSSPHPPAQMRVDRIAALHPRISSVRGCKTPIARCEW